MFNLPKVNEGNVNEILFLSRVLLHHHTFVHK